MAYDLSYPLPPGTPREVLELPCYIVDLDAMERNNETKAAYFKDRLAKLRSHMKHHKTPAIARKQVEYGAVGVCCQKLGEAEAMADGGVDNIHIICEIIGATTKMRRLMNLARRIDLIVTVDDAGNVQDSSEAAQTAGVSLGILVDVNSGQNRCSVEVGGVPDEHLTVRLTDSDSRQLRHGDQVEPIPGHDDTTSHYPPAFSGCGAGSWRRCGR